MKFLNVIAVAALLLVAPAQAQQEPEQTCEFAAKTLAYSIKERENLRARHDKSTLPEERLVTGVIHNTLLDYEQAIRNWQEDYHCN